MIQIRKLCLSFGTQTIFDNISCNINGYDKIGLVGLNGSGKSTLLKIIAGQQEPDDGTIGKIAHKKIGYMPQEVVLASTKSAVEEVMSSVEIFDETETESVRAESKKMLMSLGFSSFQLDQLVSDLSVGWRMRVVLAQLLMQKADFYLFDEPTNHLDIVTKEWFLQFLKRANFGFLLVCHERYFLDNICTSILELEHGNGVTFKGNYSAYLTQKSEQLAALRSAYTGQQKEIARKQATIDRFKASASRSTMAKSMQKQLEKVERVELPPDTRKMEFKLPPIIPSGRMALTVSNVQHAFGDKKIFTSVSCSVERQEKVAIIAANGVGKTTLLNVIMGKLALQNGQVAFGHNVTTAFFEQDQVRALNPEKTVFETMQDAGPHANDFTIRNMLGCFLFSQDLIHKKTKVLSGGERNRLSMACVLLKQANVLLLDEPTNHLDIPSKEILLKALKLYEGTVLFVSHDQDFINNLATHIVELTPYNAYKYSGNYDEFLDQRQFVEYKTEPAESSGIAVEKPEVTSFERSKEIRRLAGQIEKVEQEMEKLSLELGDHDYGTPEFSGRYERIEELQKKHKALFTTWEQLSSAEINTNNK